MVDTVDAPDPTTVVFRLKFATSTFLPALADPFAFIYQKAILDKDPHWYEKNVMGSGPFKFVELRDRPVDQGRAQPGLLPQGAAVSRRLHRHLRRKQVVRVDAIRSDRAAMEFRGLPPSALDDLPAGTRRQDHGADRATGTAATWSRPTTRSKPFDDVRVRRALLLAIDQWNGAPALSKIANVHTVGGIVFPGSPLAATKEELQKIAGFWPDIEKSRAEARRLLKEAGAGEPAASSCSTATSTSRTNTSAPGWSTNGARSACKATQRVLPTGPGFEAMRTGDFDVVVEANCNSVVNPVLDTHKYLPHVRFAGELRRLQRSGSDRDLREDAARDRLRQATGADATVRDAHHRHQAHEFPMLWWYRMVPERSYVQGWKISPSHFINQDLSNIWLDERPNG